MTVVASRGAYQRRTPTSDLAWQDRAACHGSDVSFFPEDVPDGPGGRVERRRVEITAKRLCTGCEVQLHCLEYAVAERIEHGIWGGATVEERRLIIRTGGGLRFRGGVPGPGR